MHRLNILGPVIKWSATGDRVMTHAIYPRLPDYGPSFSSFSSKDEPVSSYSSASDSSPGPWRPRSPRCIVLSSDTEADGPSTEAAATKQRSPASQAPNLSQRPLSPSILQNVELADFRCQPLSPKRIRRTTPNLPVAIVIPNPREPETEEVALSTPMHGSYDDYPDDIPSFLRILSQTDWKTAEWLYSPADDNDLLEL